MLEDTDQLHSEEHSIMTLNITAENDGLTTINHQTVVQNLAVYNFNCAATSFSENVGASNVSETDLIVEDNKNPTRFHVKGLNLKLITVLYRLAGALGICFIVGLFALPILFFYIRPSSDSDMSNSSSMVCYLVTWYVHTHTHTHTHTCTHACTGTA